MNTFSLISAIILTIFSFSHGEEVVDNSVAYYSDYEALDSDVQFGGDIACCGLGSCENTDIVAISTSREYSFIYCYGAKGCMDTKIRTSNEVQCYGSGSCVNMSVVSHAISHNIRCYGSYSCATSNTLRAGELIVGNGFRSLVGATLEAENSEENEWSVVLYGYQAAKNVQISSASSDISVTITAKGYESLLNSNIYCTYGITCTVTCKIGACVDSYIYVDDVSTLDLTCDSDDYCLTEVSDEDDLPIILSDDFSDEDIYDVPTEGVQNLIKKLYADLVLDTDDVETLGCDDESSCLDQSFSSDSDSQILFCDGYNACESLSIELADINTYCSGHYSCHSSSFSSSLESSTTLFVACSGFIACQSSTFSNIPYILGIGYLAGEDAIITDVEKIDAYGNNVFPFATITISAEHEMTITSYGTVTFNEASIHVRGTLDADFKGYNAGYKTEIYCYANSQCTISCYYYSCKDLIIYYSNSADVELDCADQDEDTDYCGELVELSHIQMISQISISNQE